MYNIYKYKEDVALQQSIRAHDQSYTKWLVRHEGTSSANIEIKNQASQRYKQRMEQFLSKQSQSPSVYEDDHYKTWRYIKQFRDVEDQKKFIGFKAFQHKPNKEMDKYYSQRQRKQINYLAEKSQQLVHSKVIPHQQISRSLRSQGPLNPKHTFRQIKQDKHYLQPRMRYTNITDEERFNQTSLTYDDKFQSLYKSFHMTKSKIGQTKKSAARDPPQQQHFDMIESTYSDIDKGENYHYEATLNQQQKHQKALKSERRAPSQDMGGRMNKTYFKTAKTLSLFGNRKAKDLMLRSQYDRKKDLTNIVQNAHHEGYRKKPIL